MTRSAVSDCFPLATWYAPAPDTPAHALREPSAAGRFFGYTERHVQAVWYDPRWRPDALIGHRGEAITVESPGVWNLEAGPDFVGATLRVGPDRRRIQGDVEVHVFPAAWKHHGHARDRRYRNVCLHLTYFEGVLDEDELPPGALQAALRPVLKADPGFSFEHVDITAYPYAGRADQPPCRTELAAWPIEDRRRLLEAAGHERLRAKAERYSDAIREKGVDQVLYEVIMAALGYRHNKPAFQALATLLPVEQLRARSGGDPLRAYALLAGVSGLLPAEIKPGWDDETRAFLRGLWDVWWKERDQGPPPLERSQWRLSGLRPLNHPLRRLAAAARLFTAPLGGLALLSAWELGEAEQLTQRMAATLDGTSALEVYWRKRASLGGRPTAHVQALLGEDRWEAIALNTVIPMLAACGADPRRVERLVNARPPETGNQVIRQTAFYLFGPDHPTSLLADAKRRQGLQQIFHDHCLTDRSRCHACPFPGWLKRMRSAER